MGFNLFRIELINIVIKRIEMGFCGLLNVGIIFFSLR